MHMLDLPDDVLTAMLRMSLHYARVKDEDFKHNLRLLAVCQKLRYAALPLVYNSVFFYSCDASLDDDFNELPSDPLDKEPTGRLMTNLDLVVSAGCIEMVRFAGIYADYPPFILPGLWMGIDNMRKAASEWSRIVALDIAIYPSIDFSDSDVVDIAACRDEIQEISTAMAGAMPGILRLEAECKSNALSSELLGHLTSHYTEQLQVLHSKLLISPPLDRQFKQLRDLCIHFDGLSGQDLPRVLPGNLERLRLVKFPADHSWASFSESGDSKSIHFPRLRRLHLNYTTPTEADYQTGQHDDGHAWELHFPSLKSVNIFCSADICPMLTYAVFPPQLDVLQICANATVVQLAMGMALPVVRHIALNIRR